MQPSPSATRPQACASQAPPVCGELVRRLRSSLHANEKQAAEAQELRDVEAAHAGGEQQAAEARKAQRKGGAWRISFFAEPGEGEKKAEAGRRREAETRRGAPLSPRPVWALRQPRRLALLSGLALLCCLAVFRRLVFLSPDACAGELEGEPLAASLETSSPPPAAVSRRLAGLNGGGKSSQCKGGTYWDTREASCLPCPAGTFSFYGSVGVQRCMDCPFGSYSAAGAAVCTVCGANMTTASTGSVSAEACFCESGFKPETSKTGDMACVACEPLFEFCYRTSPTDTGGWWAWEMVCSDTPPQAQGGASGNSAARHPRRLTSRYALHALPPHRPAAPSPFSLLRADTPDSLPLALPPSFTVPAALPPSNSSFVPPLPFAASGAADALGPESPFPALDSAHASTPWLRRLAAAAADGAAEEDEPAGAMLRGFARGSHAALLTTLEGSRAGVEHPFCETLRANNTAGFSYRLKCLKDGVCTGDVAKPCTEGNTGVLCNTCANGYTLALLRPDAKGCRACSAGLIIFFLLPMLGLCVFAGFVVWLARGNDVNAFNRNVVICRALVSHFQFLTLLKYRGSWGTNALAQAWGGLVLYLPVENLIECIAALNGWLGTTFTRVLVGLFWPVVNVCLALAIAAVLRKLHLKKLREEIAQAVRDDAYLSPAFNLGAGPAAMRTAEDRWAPVRARAAERQRQKAGGVATGREGARGAGTTALRGEKRFGKSTHAEARERAKKEGLPRAAMAAREVQEKRAQQLAAKQKAKKKKNAKRRDGFQRGGGQIRAREEEEDAEKAKDGQQDEEEESLSSASSSSPFASSMAASAAIAPQKTFTSAARHGAAPPARVAAQQEDDEGVQTETGSEYASALSQSPEMRPAPGFAVPPLEEEEEEEDQEGEEEPAADAPKMPTPQAPNLRDADFYEFWKWFVAVFFVLHYCCLVTIGKLLFAGMFCIMDDAIPKVSYSFLVADFSVPCGAAGSWWICGAAGLLLWVVILPCAHFFCLYKKLRDDIWLTDQYSLLCAWTVYGYRSGYRLMHGVKLMTMVSIMVVTSVPVNHAVLPRAYDAPGGIIFPFSSFKIITSSQVIIAINIIIFYLIILFLFRPAEPTKFAVTHHIGTFSCIAVLAFFISMYYTNIAPGARLTFAVNVTGLVLQFVFFALAFVALLVESGTVKKLRGKAPFIDSALAQASNKIKKGGHYRPLKSEEEERGMQERWEAMRMARAAAEAERDQQARHARLGLGDAATQGVGAHTVERAAVLRLTSKADQIALLDAVTACKSIPRALAAFQRLTFLPDFPTIQKSDALAALDKFGFAIEELETGLKLFLKHRTAMTRFFSRFTVSNLEEAFYCGWELGVLRYPELDDVKLQLVATKQAADRALEKARREDIRQMGQKSMGVYREDVHLWKALKLETCRITLQCLLLDLSDYHFHIPRELPRRRFLATGTDQDMQELAARHVAEQEPAAATVDAEERLDVRALLRLRSGEEGGSDGHGGFYRAGVKLHEFAEAEPKPLRHKRLLEHTYALFRDFTLLFPNALPCIDGETGAQVQTLKADAAKETREAASPAEPVDPYRTTKLFQLNVLGHDISADDGRDVLFRGHFRSVAGPSGALTGLDVSGDARSVIVLDPPVTLHSRCSIECWVSLPLPAPPASPTDSGVYRALCADSDGDIVCALRQGLSRRARAWARHPDDSEFDNANVAGEKSRDARLSRELHFGLYLFPEHENGEDEDDDSDAEPKIFDAPSDCESDREAAAHRRRARAEDVADPGGGGGDGSDAAADAAEAAAEAAEAAAEAAEAATDAEGARGGEKENGFFEVTYSSHSEKGSAKLQRALEAPGWHHLLISRCESGTGYYWDGACVGFVSSLALPFAGFLDIEAIGNTREGGHAFGAFADFTVFSVYMDDEQVKQRYTYLVNAHRDGAAARAGPPPPPPPTAGLQLSDEEDATGAPRTAVSRAGVGARPAGALELDMLIEVYFIPASSRGSKWALCATSPPQMKATVYRRATEEEQARRAKRGRSADLGQGSAADACLVRCDRSGKGGVGFVTPGPARGTEAGAYGGSTANGGCVVLDPPVAIRRELVAQQAWTLFAWISTPLPETGGASSRVLVAGERSFHVCLLSDRRSVGMAFCTGGGPRARGGDGERGQARGWEDEDDEEESSDAESADSDGCQREEYPSGLDIRDLADGWHRLCVVGTQVGQAFYVDGELRGYLPKAVWEDIRFLGNSATGHKPWGTFAHVRIHGKYFSVADVASEFATWRIKYLGIAPSGAPAPREVRDETSLSANESVASDAAALKAYLRDPYTHKPNARYTYKGHLVLELCSDGVSVVLLPPEASQTYDIRVFRIDTFSPGVTGDPVAFDCLESLAAQRRKRAQLSGGGIRVRPGVPCKRGWTIVGWIQTPIENTELLHALVGGKAGEAHVVVDRDAQTLGVCTRPKSEAAREMAGDSTKGYKPFIRSTATLKDLTDGWHQLAVTRDKFFQYFYLDGVYAGAAPATCEGSITCFGNARSEDGEFRMPFGRFNTIFVYSDSMPPPNVAQTYQEHQKLIKAKRFNPLPT